MSIDVYDEDISLIQSPMASSSDLQEHLSFMLADNRRKAEVNIRDSTDGERKLMEAANDKSDDQWISNSVFKIVRRAGIPIKHSMTMIWILTWKEAPEGTTATSRLVANGFTDPDLLTIRVEAPTLSNIGRHCLLQIVCSHKFKLEVGDVSTAFPQGDKHNKKETFILNQQPTSDNVLT